MVRGFRWGTGKKWDRSVPHGTSPPSEPCGPLARHTAPGIASEAGPKVNRNTAGSVCTPRRAAPNVSRPFSPATDIWTRQLLALSQVGRLSAWATRPIRPVSRCLSAAGIRFLGHLPPAGELSLPRGRPTGTIARLQRGYHVPHRSRREGGGRPLYPGV